jgi:hypothetical protein
MEAVSRENGNLPDKKVPLNKQRHWLPGKPLTGKKRAKPKGCFL